jgi:hypothetical protein
MCLLLRQNLKCLVLLKFMLVILLHSPENIDTHMHLYHSFIIMDYE